MTFDSLTNRGEFFSNHYLDAIMGGDLGDLRRRWEEHERAHKATARSRLRSLSKTFFPARAVAAEASRIARPDAVRGLNREVLEALGFTVRREVVAFTHTTTDELQVPAAATVETGSGLLLVALDADLADDVDDLFDTSETATTTLLDPVDKVSEKGTTKSPADAVGEIFGTDEPPRWVLVVAGHIVLLAERAKWAEGRFLAVDLDTALERNDTRAKGELETIAALFSTDALVPDEGQSEIDKLTEASHKHAVGVSKELREGIRQSIEILANEVIAQRLATNRAVYEGENRIDPRKLTTECLRFLYRLLVLLYAESRPELGIVPLNDEVYRAGYSLDRFRDLVLVDLETDEARHGSHIHESLQTLFELVNSGYHADHAQTALRFDLDAVDPEESYEDYLQFPGLDAALFDPAAAPLLAEVTLRNEPLQKVLQLLMLSSKGRGRNADRGFVSYAQLGINQLGAVYEGLMAYTGFFADTDLYEIAKGGDPSDGTWVLPVEDADEYPEEVFVTREDPVTGAREPVVHRRGDFVFRLSGRDRQRSASYYTPEVLTRSVVKHALAELLGLDDYAPENGSSGITEARQILDITICEPALGSGAFLNEAINQLSAEYLRRRQAELGEVLDPERYNRELQKVKAHFALHQSYGIDLNATAVELAEVSLWLNCMHPGLKAPWFGLQLQRGNSLVGCRRATWRHAQLDDRPWAETRKDHLQPPRDRDLAEPLDDDEIHHFLLPGHGWAAVADRKEAKELRPERATALKNWRRQVLRAPKPRDAERLAALAGGVERLWTQATERIRLARRALRRPIELWGAGPMADRDPAPRQKVIEALQNPDSDLGRLRTVMDAWVGLWFWPLDTEVDPPTWRQWLAALEDLIDPDAVVVGDGGQLDLFEDLPALLEADQLRLRERPTVADLRNRHPWLGLAIDLARREGAWHWPLEFAPEFARGGFDLQVGNPPWVRPVWRDDLVLAEFDPWWGVTEKPPTAMKEARRAANLATTDAEQLYVAELAVAEGLVESLSSPVQHPVLTGVQTNLYMVFMDVAWRNARPTGSTGLIHPETHFTDPKATELRASAYRHARRHWQFVNELFLFEDVHHMTTFGVHVYGRPRPPRFLQMGSLFHPSVVDQSLDHDGSGETPGIQYESGGWDLRPHTERLVTITEDVLADWARMFDDPGTPAAEARLLRPVTRADLEGLSVLADQPVRLADHEYQWSPGWHESGAKKDGTIRWDTRIPEAWDEVILQGPHFTVATPFAKQPNENCQHNLDYSDWDLETLPERVIPRTNYQRACDRDTYFARLDHWNGRPFTNLRRLIIRAMTGPGSERCLLTALAPADAAHVHGVLSMGGSDQLVATFQALSASIPLDYLAKVAGMTNVSDNQLRRLPAPLDSSLVSPLLSRSLRLNCLTTQLQPFWQSLFAPEWRADRWALPHAIVGLGDVGPQWTAGTPLRRDVDRRQALVEIDALAALMLGLTAEQLCAMYRTQFAVLRKYEYSMAFDAEGRKICQHHQSAGYRQSRLQAQAKDGELPREWKSVWKLYELWEEDPNSVDWRGHFHPPFYRPDREAEMTAAYNEFRRRLDTGVYT